VNWFEIKDSVSEPIGSLLNIREKKCMPFW
jgi:hypothetical protein